MREVDSFEQHADTMKQLMGTAREIEVKATGLLNKPLPQKQFDVLLRIHDVLHNNSNVIECCHRFIQGFPAGNTGTRDCVKVTYDTASGLMSLVASLDMSLETSGDAQKVWRFCSMLDDLDYKQNLFCLVLAMRRTVNFSFKLLKWSSPSESRQPLKVL